MQDVKYKDKFVTKENMDHVAAIIAKKLPKSTALSYSDIFQDAWIELQKRIGKPIGSSIQWVAADLKRMYYGRYLTEEELRAKYLLNHMSFDDAECTRRKKSLNHNFELETDYIYTKIYDYLEIYDSRLALVFKIVASEQYINNVGKRISEVLNVSESLGHQLKRELHEVLKAKFPQFDPGK